MDWLEFETLALLRSLAEARARKGGRDLRSRSASAFRVLLGDQQARLPIDVYSEQGASLYTALRKVVCGMELRHDANGLKVLLVDTDLDGLFRPAERLRPARMAHRFDAIAKARAEQAAKRVSAGEAARAAADAGTYDIPDKAWRVIAPSFERVDLSFDDRVLSPRLLLDGLLCLVGTGSTWARLPARFGEPVEFKRAWMRIVYKGVWDDIAAILQRHFPSLISKKHLDLLSGANFERAPERGPRRLLRFGPVETPSLRRELDALEQELPNDIRVQAKIYVLRDILDGHDREEIAYRNFLQPKHVAKFIRAFRDDGTDSIRPADRREAPPVRRAFSPEQLAQLLHVASQGLDRRNARNSELLTFARLRDWSAETLGVSISLEGLRRTLLREGVDLPAIVAAIRRGRAQAP